MTEAIIRPAVAVAPSVTKRPFGVLDVATITEGLPWVDPVSMLESYNCLVPTVADWTCPATDAKDFDHQPTWLDGYGFFAYLGTTCKSFADDSVQDAVGNVYGLQESLAVETGLAPTLTAAPEVITGNFSVVDALGLLEQDAGAHYAGVPTIHMSRWHATSLLQLGALRREGNALYTALGSKVVVSSAYPTTEMYATGEVALWRGETVLKSILDRSTNDVVTMAERPYIAAFDCYSAMIHTTEPTAAP